MFALFDPGADVRITVGNLPHWFQSEVTYFVTFRTADSMPKEVAGSWYRRRDDWLRRHGVDPAGPSWTKQLRSLPLAQQNEFHATFSSEYLECLDKGHGECVLRRPELAGITAQALRHFDGHRYHLGDLRGHAQPRSPARLPRRGHRDRSPVLLVEEVHRHGDQPGAGPEGRFWQEESFDHLVRSPEQLAYLQRYIADNPVRAGLRAGEFLHWVREESSK